jgi:hypothetical protein
MLLLLVAAEADEFAWQGPGSGGVDGVFLRREPNLREADDWDLSNLGGRASAD